MASKAVVLASVVLCCIIAMAEMHPGPGRQTSGSASSGGTNYMKMYKQYLMRKAQEELRDEREDQMEDAMERQRDMMKYKAMAQMHQAQRGGSNKAQRSGSNKARGSNKRQQRGMHQAQPRGMTQAQQWAFGREYEAPEAPEYKMGPNGWYIDNWMDYSGHKTIKFRYRKYFKSIEYYYPTFVFRLFSM